MDVLCILCVVPGIEADTKFPVAEVFYKKTL